MGAIAWWEIIGWIGSALVVVSLVVPSVRRFRRLNALGSFIATVYNAVFGIWPYFAMNLVITIIDLYWLAKLRKEKNSINAGNATTPSALEALPAYSLTEVSAQDPLVRHFLIRHGADIKKTYPTVDVASLSAATLVMVSRADELVGIVALLPHNDGRAQVLVDWVTERFRDYSPGSFVYSSAGMFRSLGVQFLDIDPSTTNDSEYFLKQGFVRDGERLIRAV